MFESIRSIWNFSVKRQGQLLKILFLSFIEGIFVMLKMKKSLKRHYLNLQRIKP